MSGLAAAAPPPVERSARCRALVAAEPTRTAWILVGGLTAVALVLRLVTFRDSLQGDELYMFNIVHGHSLGQALHLVRATEKTPPLVFILDWFTSRLGDPTMWIRLPSLISGVALVPVTYALGRRIGAAPRGSSPPPWWPSARSRSSTGSRTAPMPLSPC